MLLLVIISPHVWGDMTAGVPVRLPSKGAMDSRDWFAIRVRYQAEKVVLAALLSKGHEAFLPLHTVQRKWADRVKSVDAPLFPGYVFCRFGADRWDVPVITTPGVIGIVRTGSVPAPIPQAEIESIQTVLSRGLMVQSCPFEPGVVVRITEGPLAGVRGTILEVKNQRRLLLSVTLLQRTVFVDLSAQAIAIEGAGGSPNPASHRTLAAHAG